LREDTPRGVVDRLNQPKKTDDRVEGIVARTKPILDVGTEICSTYDAILLTPR